ncbi:DUF6318 family protein [Nocardioides sp.]|uniref:DUF6318 family protein n=1 Tax=Nocardioides sp. TaxID=35761 RepID=UPI0035143CCA
MLRRVPVMAVLSVVIGLLAACGGGGDPGATAPMSPGAPSPSSSGSRTTAAPSPDLTVAPPGETAEEFIRRWYALLDDAQTSGRTDAFLAASGPECESCKDFAKNVRSIYAAGGSVEGGRTTILSLRSESKTQWVVAVRAEESRVRRTSAAPVELLEGGPLTSRMYLVDVGGKWLVGATEGLR